MSGYNRPCDVLLCYGEADRAFGEMVEQAFRDAGLRAVRPWDAPPERVDGVDRDWEALIESAAVVGIVRSGDEVPSSVLVAIGAAKAWDKPVYIVTDTIRPLDVPRVVAALPHVPVYRLNEVSDRTRRDLAPLQDQHRTALAALYADRGEPLDALVTRRGGLEAMAKEFRRRTGATVSRERLVRELVRLRKGRRIGPQARGVVKRRVTA